MKPGARLRLIVAVASVLSATALLAGLIYQSAYDTLRSSHQQMLDRSVRQGVFLVESSLRTEFSLLSLYAAVPSIRGGQFPDLPDWLVHPDPRAFAPKRLTIIDAAGHARASTGQTFEAGDREYFREARDGRATIAGPLTSRVDQGPVVVLAQPIPGGNPKATVLTASLDLSAFARLLESVQGLSGALLTLSDSAGTVLAQSGSTRVDIHGPTLQATLPLSVAPWTLTARIAVSEVLKPVQQVLLIVALLVTAGVVLVLIYVLTGLRHRRDLEQAREDRTQALRDAYEQIRKLAYHDTVTRLPNRNLTTRRISEAIQGNLARRVFVVALARFRSLATTFGLKIGDAVLKQSAARLLEFTARDPKAFVARVGSGEFLLLLDAELWRADDAGRLVDLFELPIRCDDLQIQASVHIGTCLLAEGGTTAEEVIKSAETALWAAREKGPSETSELTLEAVSRRSRRADLQSRLPGARDRGELQVVFQPQVSLAGGQVEGYEALLRWTSPHLGSVPPAEFIPVAEEIGAIVPIGAWVLAEGIRFAAALEAAGTPAVVSVNVSPVQILQPGFLDDVALQAGAAGLSPGRLGLEITESVLMEGIDLLRPALERLRARGIKLSLDDFGTGYSSLTYLKDLPLDELKIDRGFIEAMEGDHRAGHLVACIVDLAHALGLRVLAEGVETEAQRQRLAVLGCDLAQGFHTGRPRPASDIL